MKLKTVIIDDEIDSITVIRALLIDFPQFDVIRTYTESQTALLELKFIKFDVLFLDIHMPHLNGFKFLEKLNRKDFQLIFITAYDNYALKAFRMSALDYLQKPIDPETFSEALNRISFAKNPDDVQIRLETLKSNLDVDSTPRKIIIPTSSGFNVEEVNSIISLSADGSYTTIHTIKNKKYVVSQNLKTFNYLLDFECFERIHHSHMINLNHIKQFKKTDGGEVILSDGQVVSVSVRKKGKFLTKLKNYLGIRQL